MDYRRLRGEIHSILLNFLDREFECRKAGEFDSEYMEFKTDEVIQLIKDCGGSIDESTEENND